MLRTFADNMRDAVRMENTGMLIENDVNFHQYYTDYCGNARLADIICSTVDPFHRFRYIHLVVHENEPRICGRNIF